MSTDAQVYCMTSIYFDHYLPLKPSMGKRRKQSCTSNRNVCMNLRICKHTYERSHNRMLKHTFLHTNVQTYAYKLRCYKLKDMNPAMIVCHFVYLIPAIAFFTRILFEIFLIVELVTIRVAYAKLS